MTLGELIRAERERKGISMSELARQIGVSKCHLSELERDIQDNPTKRILNALMNNLSIPAQTLLEAD